MERNCEACKYYVTSEDKTGCTRWECKYDERMTNEEAIRILENYKPEVKRATLAAKRAKEAFDMAISALKENKGKWKKTYLDHVAMGERPSILYCSVCCQCVAYPTNYCPNCGAKMKGGE